MRSDPIPRPRPGPVGRRLRPLLFAAGLLALAAAPATASADGPATGLRALKVPYHDTTIDVALWYPTTASPRRLDAGPFALQVATGAPLPEGRRPLVLISHGTGGSNLGHYPIAQALVQAGFIVASPMHPGDNYRDRSMIADTRYFHERPRQVSRVLDALLADPDWGPRIDPARIGAAGHSAGGYTVAALAGARPDVNRLQAHCRAVGDDPACAFRDPSYGVMQPTATPLRLPDSVVAGGEIADPRIKAVVMMASLGAVVVPGSLAATQARVRLIGAGQDEALARRFHHDALAAELPASAVSIVEGAGHYSFIAPIEPAMRGALGPVAKDPPGFDRAAFQARLAPELAQWFAGALPAAGSPADAANPGTAPGPAAR